MQIIDLSQEISPQSQVFPAYPHPIFLPWTKREIVGFEAEVIFMATHTGTHIDAPYHFVSGGMKISDISLDRLVGEGIVLDFSDKREKDFITANDIMDWEDKNDIEIGRENIVLIRTGWDRYLGKDEYITMYPGITKEAAEYIASKSPKALGVDTPNPDHPDDTLFITHRTLLPREILIIENLTNLDRLPPTGFRFVGLPLRLRDLSGSPIRAVAIME